VDNLTILDEVYKRGIDFHFLANSSIPFTLIRLLSRVAGGPETNDWVLGLLA
jgi:hypothetical protein